MAQQIAVDHLDVTVEPSPRPSSIVPGSVGIVGLGYVGLPTALSLAQAGVPIVGYDVDPRRLTAISALDVDLADADRAVLARHVGADQFQLTTDPGQLTTVECIVVCVPTPITEDQAPDLTILRSACDDVVSRAVPGQTIVLTSTTYVGCTRDFVAEPLQRRGFTPGATIHVAFSPERIDPGVVDHRPETTPRVVGGYSPACTAAAQRLLESTTPSMHPVTSLEAAEMCKLLENTYRAVNISMMNEFADAAHALGVNIREVVDAAATKPYGFHKFLPGPGVGGHCIPCDPHYLLWQLRKERLATPVVSAAMSGIALRPRCVMDRIEHELLTAGVARDQARVHISGAAYKPDVADSRESPALVIIEGLRQRGIAVEFSDRHISDLPTSSGVLRRTDPAGTAADLVLIHTRHTGDINLWSDFPGIVLDATYTEKPRPGVHFL